MPVTPVAEPVHEKRGNCLWAICPACRTRFPIGAALADPHATVPAICPACHHPFHPGRPAREERSTP